MVFNIIYELIFLKTHYNFGFRPNKSPQNEMFELVVGIITVWLEATEIS